MVVAVATFPDPSEMSARFVPRLAVVMVEAQPVMAD